MSTTPTPETVSPADNTAPAQTPVEAPAKAAVKKVAPVAKKVAKPAVKPAVKVATQPVAEAAVKAVAKPKAEKVVKVKKAKLVRDSFTIPKPEYLVLDELKLRAVKLASPAKKTELIRAGIKALAAMSDASLLAALKAVPAIKTGRPAKD